MAPADVRKAGEERALNLCSTCHGPRGVSTSPEFPILAAQRRGYLESQIDAFRKLFPEGNSREAQALNGRVVQTDVPGFAAPVPEPDAVILFALGSLVLCACRVRRGK